MLIKYPYIHTHLILCCLYVMSNCSIVSVSSISHADSCRTPRCCMHCGIWKNSFFFSPFLSDNRKLFSVSVAKFMQDLKRLVFQAYVGHIWLMSCWRNWAEEAKQGGKSEVHDFSFSGTFFGNVSMEEMPPCYFYDTFVTALSTIFLALTETNHLKRAVFCL